MANHWQDNAYARQPVQPRPSDAERWQTWCDTIDAAIEALRADEAPVRCPTCGCSAHLPERQCSQCQVVKPLAHFNRDKRLPLGRVYQCKECRRPQRRSRYLEEKRGKFQTVLWGAAS